MDRHFSISPLTAVVLFSVAACASPHANFPDDPVVKGEKQPENRDWGGSATQSKGRVLSGNELQSRLSGRTLSGCYPNGQQFSERNAPDGRLYDMTQNGQETGRWYIDGDQVCYVYPTQNGAESKTCAYGVEDKTGLHFYQKDRVEAIASTDCNYNFSTQPPTGGDKVRTGSSSGTQTQQRSPAPPQGNRLTASQLKSLVSGKTLNGCYPNGEKFSEQNTPNGFVRDMLKNGETVARWYIKADELCYAYPQNNGTEKTTCVYAVPVQNGLDFYVAGNNQAIASTVCR